MSSALFPRSLELPATFSARNLFPSSPSSPPLPLLLHPPAITPLLLQINFTTFFSIKITTMNQDMNPSKRRRLDVASKLSKPFKPPLPKSTSTPHQLDPTSTHPQITPQTPEPPRPSKNEEDDTHLTSPSPVSKTIPERSSFSPSNSPKIYRHRPIPRYCGLSTPSQSPLGDPEVLTLQRQQSALRARLKAMRAELDTANQAVRIESSTKDAELEALIVKWRHVSQDAADEVFEGAYERVKRMGGMAAWKEQSKRDTSRWDFENDDLEREEDEDEGQPLAVHSENTNEAPDLENHEEVSCNISHDEF